MREPFGGAAASDDVKLARLQHHITLQQCYTLLTEPIRNQAAVLSTLPELVNGWPSNRSIMEKTQKRGVCMHTVVSPH